jgi:hypothetical protein
MLWEWLSGLEAAVWAALLGALSGSLAAYVLRKIEELRRRQRELRGLRRLLDVVTGYNEEILNTYSERPDQVADPYRRRLSTRAWDKTSVRLTQLLKDDELLEDLAEYYEEIQAIAEYARYSEHTPVTKRQVVPDLLPRAISLSNRVRPRLKDR